MNNLRAIQSNNFDVVRGDSLIMPFELVNFQPYDQSGNVLYEMEMDIVDPFTKEVIPMALGTTYTKRHNTSSGEGIYYNSDTNLPIGVVLSSGNQIAIKLNPADTDLLKANQGYFYDVRIIRGSGQDLVSTIIRGVINVKKRALDG